jgi:hypothetical protein
MHHPFIQTRRLSEEELLKKISELSTKLMYARGLVGDRSMIASLEQIIDAYQDEYQERLSKQAQEHWNKQFPSVIESDPEFKISKDGKKTGGVGIDAKPSFNNKFSKLPHLDITPVPTRHAPVDDSDKKE